MGNGYIIQPLKNEEILLFMTTQMDLEGIMPSEINKKVRHIVCSHLHVESKHAHTHTHPKFIEKEVRHWLPEVRSRGRGTGKKVVKRYKFTVIR